MGRRASSVIIGICLASSACAAIPKPRAEQPAIRAAEPYRPGWTAGLGLHIDDIRLCLAGREAPTAVVHVQALTTGATGVTAVDGLGQVENCAVHEGHVVMREPADLDPADLAGLPMFAVTPDPPSVAPGVLMEEVGAAEVVLGWLYWPTAAEREDEPFRSPGVTRRE